MIIFANTPRVISFYSVTIADFHLNNVNMQNFHYSERALQYFLLFIYVTHKYYCLIAILDFNKNYSKFSGLVQLEINPWFLISEIFWMYLSKAFSSKHTYPVVITTIYTFIRLWVDKLTYYTCIASKKHEISKYVHNNHQTIDRKF